MLLQGGERLVHLVPVDPAHDLEVGEKIDGSQTEGHRRLITSPLPRSAVVRHEDGAEELSAVGDDDQRLRHIYWRLPTKEKSIKE